MKKKTNFNQLSGLCHFYGERITETKFLFFFRQTQGKRENK